MHTALPSHSQLRLQNSAISCNFEGVDSCFYVWVTANLSATAKISHSSSEFEISSFVNEGTNTLAVLVLKWCDGTYLEDQDKLRMSGNFP